MTGELKQANKLNEREWDQHVRESSEGNKKSSSDSKDSNEVDVDSIMARFNNI